MNLEYNVGQILYVVFKGEKKIVPLQVIEEVTRRTLEGQKVDYQLSMGPDEKKTLMFSEIDGDVFETPEIAIEILSERAKISIERLVNQAVDMSKVWYVRSSPSPVKEEPQAATENAQQTSNEEEVRVKLPDGTYARVKFPVSA